MIGNWISGGGAVGLPHLRRVRAGMPGRRVEHIDSIVDMRRFLVMEQASMPETAMGALLSMEQRGHPWRGTTYSRTDWAEGLDVPTLAEKPDAEVSCSGWAAPPRSNSAARASPAPWHPF